MSVLSSEASVQAGLAMAWYCVRSQPKHEHVAARNLRRYYGFEVLNPRLRFKRCTNRGAVWVTEPVFPSYLFVRFDWLYSLNTVIHTGGVAGVVHFGNFWPTIPAGVIDELRTIVGAEEIRTVEQTIKPGDQVEITGGTFDGLKGVVTRVMPARERVGLLMDFLGRQTLVEVGLDRIVNTNGRYAAQLL